MDEELEEGRLLMDFILCHRLCEEQPETGRDFLFLRGDKLFRGKAVEKDSLSSCYVKFYYCKNEKSVL